MGVQIYELTHGGQDNSFLPADKRQFISFSYGGKWIEEFDLVVVFNNDRLEKGVYGNFSDITSNNPLVDGQLFWASAFDNNGLNLTLATDGMTQNQLDAFTEYFRPGVSRELILSEKPNRYIYARVSATPTISLLPFKEVSSILIGGQERQVNINIYKGEISLSFVMDDPFWRSKVIYYNEKTALTDEVIKNIYDDNVPYLTDLPQDKIIFLAGNQLYNSGVLGEMYAGLSPLVSLKPKPVYKAPKEGYKVVNLNKDAIAYIFSANDTPISPILKFSCKVELDSTTGMITHPGKVENEYDYIKFAYKGNENKIQLGTGSIFSSFNKVKEICKTYLNPKYTFYDLRDEIKNNVVSYWIRSWAIYIIELMKNNSLYAEPANAQIKSEAISIFYEYFLLCIQDDEGAFYSYDISINTELGICEIEGLIRKVGESVISLADLKNKTKYELHYLEENCSEMIKDRYLPIEGKSIKNSETGKYSENDMLQISSSMNLAGLTITYDYKYL